MSYVPTNWQTGDVITASKLNKIEQGIENTNILITNATIESSTKSGENLVLDKTFKQIYQVYNNNGLCFIKFPGLDEDAPSVFYKDIIICMAKDIDATWISEEVEEGSTTCLIISLMFGAGGSIGPFVAATQNDYPRSLRGI